MTYTVKNHIGEIHIFNIYKYKYKHTFYIKNFFWTAN